MRTLPTIAALALLSLLAASCAEQDPGEPPPTNAFFWPVSLALVEPPGERGTLYVVNSNFDLRFNRGTLVAVDLDKLPEAIVGEVDSGPAIDPDRGFVYLDSFGGQIAPYTPAGATPAQRRLFVPTRFDNLLFTVQADGAALACLEPEQGSLGERDCLRQGIRLVESDTVRAEDPFAAAVLGDKVFVTHLRPADQPPGTGENGPSFLVEVDALSPRTLRFHEIGKVPAQAIAATTSAGVFFAGRPPFANDPAELLRGLIAGEEKPTSMLLSQLLQVSEGRGLAVSSDGERLFMTTRNPDGLLVLDLSIDPGTSKPRLLPSGDKARPPLGFVSLPKGASAMVTVARPGLRDLVAVSCSDSDLVALYDDQLGEVAALVEGIAEPFGLAAGAKPGGGARLYAASFGGDSVAVIDLPDPAASRTAALAGSLKTAGGSP